MAALTWRDVASPNFGSSNDAFRTGVSLQQTALSGLGDAIGKAIQDRKASQDSAILSRALQINDPAAYQTALNNGTLFAGVDPASLSPRTLNELGDRSSALLSQAATKQNTANAAYAQDRLVNNNNIQDNARVASADTLGITDPNLRALSPTDQRAFQQGALNLEGTILGNQGRRISNAGGLIANEGNAFRNTTTKRDDGVNQVAITAADSIRRESANPQDALAGLEELNDLQPTERAAAYDKLRTDFGNFYSGGTSGAQGASGVATGSRGGKPGTSQGSPFDATFNFQGTNQPISSQPISSVLGVQQQSIDTQGHSPMGAYQINKATLEDYGPKVLGDNWKDQSFTPANQEKIARALFEDRKGGDLSKTWSSLPNNSPGAYKDFSWEEMRQIIGRGETGQNLPDDPSSLRLLSQASQFETNRRVAQNNSAGVVADIPKNLNETRAAPELVQEAVKTQFPGADVGKLTGIVNKAQRDNPGLSAADVLSAVSRSTRDAATYNPLARGFAGTTEFAPGVGIDDSAFEANLQSLKTGKADYLSQANQLTRAQGSQVANAQQNYDQSLQNLQQLQARQQIQPGINTDRAQAAFDKASTALKRALTEQQGNPDYRPVRQ